MPHSRTRSDDLSILPPTLSVYTSSAQTNSSPIYPWSASAIPESVFHRPPLPTAFDYASTTQPPLSHYTYASTTEGEGGGVGNSSDISFDDPPSHGMSWNKGALEQGQAMNEVHPQECTQGEQGGKGGSNAKEETMELEEETTNATLEWYSKTFANWSNFRGSRDEGQSEAELSSASTYPTIRGGGGANLVGQEQDRRDFAFSFEAGTTSLGSTEYEQPDTLSPLSDDHGSTSPYDWLSSLSSSSSLSSPPRRRASYGSGTSQYTSLPLSSSSALPFASSSTSTSTSTSSDFYPSHRRASEPHAIAASNGLPSSVGLPSFSTSSPSLSQAAPTLFDFSSQPPSRFLFQPSSAFDSSPRYNQETISNANGLLAYQISNSGGGGRVSTSLLGPRRDSTQEFELPPGSTAIDSHRLSCPAPAILGPVLSPLLRSLPCPSPSFRLDDQPLAPPPRRPFEPSLIDLPPIPATVPTSSELPLPPDSPPPGPPTFASPFPSSKKNQKRRSSSISSTSSCSSSSSFDPTLKSPESSSSGSSPASHVRARRGETINQVGERISPITGKPTKVISKRSWPPKDAARRRYHCQVEGCGKTFGRPSALNTHKRTHDGVKPFNCPIPDCARPFSVFSNLKRHMLVHPTVDFRSVTVNDISCIHWIVDANDPGGAGGRLEWIDQVDEEGETEQGEGTRGST